MADPQKSTVINIKYIYVLTQGFQMMILIKRQA